MKNEFEWGGIRHERFDISGSVLTGFPGLASTRLQSTDVTQEAGVVPSRSRAAIGICPVLVAFDGCILPPAHRGVDRSIVADEEHF